MFAIYKKKTTIQKNVCFNSHFRLSFFLTFHRRSGKESALERAGRDFGFPTYGKREEGRERNVQRKEVGKGKCHRVGWKADCSPDLRREKSKNLPPGILQGTSSRRTLQRSGEKNALERAGRAIGFPTYGKREEGRERKVP